jgi:hypothetical protein
MNLRVLIDPAMNAPFGPIFVTQPPNQPLPVIGGTITLPMVQNAAGNPITLYATTITPDYDQENMWAYTIEVTDRPSAEAAS